MSSFFKVSNRCHDGLLFLGQLAVRFDSQAPLTVEDAAKQSLSAGYLEHIVVPLKKAGIVVAKRGPGGGYVLAKAPAEISVRSVVEAIEGPLALVDCQSGAGCTETARCGSRKVWDALQTHIGDALERLTLKDLV